jgi:uncharacterized protein with GYD domain
MAIYVILGRFPPEAFRDPKEFKKVAEAVSAKIKAECSGVRRENSHATLGRFDVIDFVEANEPKQIEKGAMIYSCLRTFDDRGAGCDALERIPYDALAFSVKRRTRQ